MRLPELDQFEPLRQITGNHRFITYQGMSDGVPVFLKVPANERLQERLKSEAEGMAELARRDKDETLYRVPKLIEVTPGYIATEWVDGYSMSEDFESGDQAKIKADVDYLVKLYAFFDAFPGGQGVTRFNLPDEKPQTVVTLEKIAELGADKSIDMNLAKEVASYIENALPATETRYTHGDLQPGNILYRTDGKPVIVDCETRSPLWPRHYNIVNFTFNYSRKYPQLHAVLSAAFWAYCDVVKVDATQHSDAFNVSAGMRALQLTIEKQLDAQRENKTISSDDAAYINIMMRKVVSNKLFI
jgi:hypothetical protein